MTDSQRKTKQAIIAAVFILIVGGLGFLIYRGINPPLPQPTPNPTINLTPIQVVFTKFLNIENNDYDFLAKVTNPNTDYGSPNVEYELSFIGADGATTVSKKTGSFYILPGQTKYVIDSPLKFNQQIYRTEFKILSIDWQKLDPLAAIGVPLIVKNDSFSQILKQGIFAKVGGSVLNNSDFDLNRSDVLVVLLDQSDQVLAVNKTEINTFLARTSRGFEVAWPAPFIGQVSRIDAEADANIFENSNFLRRYGGQEKFKQMY